jgi:short-subunit dehydrogenase
MAPYNITKAGMLSFSETLYGELKPFNSPLKISP